MEKGSTVLLIDDDENDSLLFQRAVKKNNFPFHVHWARNGKEAMDYMTGHGEFADRHKYPFPKFIVTDNRMPVVSGSEFLKWMKEHSKFHVVPTIVFGGSDSPGEIDRAYTELGAHSYIVKPSDNNKLQELVKLIFDYWAACQVPDCKPAPDSRNSPDDSPR